MAHGAYLRGSQVAWETSDPVQGLEFWGMDQVIYDALRESGGTYSLTSTLTIGSADPATKFLTVSAPFILAGTTATVNSGCTVTWASGSHAALAGTATMTVAGSAEIDFSGSAVLSMAGTSTALWSSGTFLTAYSGSTVSWRGTMGFTSTAVTTLASGSATTFSAGSSLDLAGVTTLKTGGSLAVETGVTISSVAGALWQLGGASVTATGTWTFTAGTIAGSLTQSAAVTRTGSEVLSGSGATTRYRVYSAPDANTTLSTAYDYIRLPAALTTSPTVYKLEDTVAPDDGLVITISRVTTDIKEAQIRRETTNDLIATFPGSNPAWVKVISIGGIWHPVEWGTDDQTTAAIDQGIADP